jgi:pantoate--beta-alanine ligase
MKILKTINELKEYRQSLQLDWNDFTKYTLGFVPTMGALHKGHEELLKRSVKENNQTILSIFVNPTQFNNQNDFEKYPITLEKDLAIAERLHVSVVFMPEKQFMYPDDYTNRVIETEFSKKLCGAYRPGHFEGVLSVVLKLFILIQAHRVYLGEKDYQQLTLIRGMSDAFFLPSEIVGVPTVRESSGLAMSSRNQRLSEKGLQLASHLYQEISSKKATEVIHLNLKNLGIDVEYIEDVGHRRYIAAFVEGVRLIDNVDLGQIK